MLSEFLVRAQQWRYFATAHSRGLRRRTCRSAVRVEPFATAHSCGLRPSFSSFAPSSASFATAHSCGLRLNKNPKNTGRRTLPQRIRAGCDVGNYKVRNKPLLCHSAFVRVATAEKQCSALRICCEKVDSFSSVGESGLALTIFPFSFAAKATYVAINDSFGRAIDRFFGANRTGISVNYDFAEHPCL